MTTVPELSIGGIGVEEDYEAGRGTGVDHIVLRLNTPKGRMRRVELTEPQLAKQALEAITLMSLRSRNRRGEK